MPKTTWINITKIVASMYSLLNLEPIIFWILPLRIVCTKRIIIDSLPAQSKNSEITGHSLQIYTDTLYTSNVPATAPSITCPIITSNIEIPLALSIHFILSSILFHSLSNFQRFFKRMLQYCIIKSISSPACPIIVSGISISIQPIQRHFFQKYSFIPHIS